MRRLNTVVSVLLIITLLFCSFSTVTGLNAGNVSIYYDNSGIYVCIKGDYSVSVKSVTSGSGYKYSFDNKVISCCVANGNLYTAMSTNQSGILIMAVAKNGKITKKFNFSTKRVGSDTRMCVDGSGRIYLRGYKGCVEVYDSKGKYIATTSKGYGSMIQIKGKIFTSDSSGIYRLSAQSETVACRCKATAGIYAASSDCIAVLSGAVYNISSGKQVFPSASGKGYSVAVGSKMVAVMSGSEVNTYDKNSGNHIKTTAIGFEPSAICACGGKVYLISGSSGGISVRKYQESYFLPSASTKSDNSSAPATNINFGKYRTKGSYIFLPVNTTRAEFKSEIKYDGYSLKFNKSGSLGTSTKAVFSKDNKTYTYTIVVMGDVSGTGRINKRDCEIMFNCLFGLDKVGGAYKIAADMNGDGKLSNVDLVMLDRKID